MSHSVQWSPQARGDLQRLAIFLAEREPRTARRMSRVLQEAVSSLSLFPMRTPVVDDEDGIRELRVKFGRYGYVIHYMVEGDVVFVAHIFHALEDR